MAYALRQDLRDIFPRINTLVFDDPEYQAVVDKWSRIVDAYVATRYAVPFADTDATPATPPLIRKLVTIFTLGDLLRRTQRMEDWVLAEIEEAWMMLKALAAGEIVLVGVDGVIQDMALSNTVDYTPVFGAVPSLGEEFDPERRDDEDAERH